MRLLKSIIINHLIKYIFMSSIEEVRKQLVTNGFNAVRTDRLCLPLSLKAIAIGELKEEHKHYPKEEVVVTKKVLGESLTRFKFFEDSKVYDILCMYGQDIHGNHYLFCKEEGDKDVFKVVNGSFVFEFSADQYFYLLTNACSSSWGFFASCCVCNNREEVEKFEKLVMSSVANDGWKSKALALVNRLYYNLNNK
jgi:hypothetical protein